jgi:hypothetical protein
MFVIVAFAVGLLVFTAVSLASMPIDGIYTKQRGEILRNDMASIMSAIEQRYEENPAGGYLTPAAIVTTPGFEHLRLLEPGRFQFQVASTLNDGVWRFNRAAIWFESPHDYVGNAQYTNAANNACGIGGLTLASSWCGRAQSVWGKLETKSNNSVLLLSEKQRAYRVISKFYQRFNKDGVFVPLANGQVQTLAQLVGYTGAAADCNSTDFSYVYSEIPFGCEDIFNYWGVPITLNKISDLHIALVNRTQITSASGQVVRIAEEARLE